MTKHDLINAVIKSCKGENLSKRLTEGMLDAVFKNIHKTTKKNVSPIADLEPSKLETAKHERVETQRLELKFKSEPARLLALKLSLN